MVGSAESIRVLSLIPGRVRVHLPGWKGTDSERIEKRVRQIKGVESVRANPQTGNVLIHFDCRKLTEKSLLKELHEAWTSCRGSEDAPAPHSSLLTSDSTLLRVGVRGVLGHAVVDSLWFGAGFLGKYIGLPLGWLGPLHVLMDIAVWTLAVRSGTRSNRTQTNTAATNCHGLEQKRKNDLFISLSF